MKKLKGSSVIKIRVEFTEREIYTLIWAVQVAEKKISKELKDSAWYGYVLGGLLSLSIDKSPLSEKEFFIANSDSLLKNIKYYENRYVAEKKAGSNDPNITVHTKHYKQRLAYLKKLLKEIDPTLIELTREALDKGEI